MFLVILLKPAFTIKEILNTIRKSNKEIVIATYESLVNDLTSSGVKASIIIPDFIDDINKAFCYVSNECVFYEHEVGNRFSSVVVLNRNFFFENVLSKIDYTAIDTKLVNGQIYCRTRPNKNQINDFSYSFICNSYTFRLLSSAYKYNTSISDVSKNCGKQRLDLIKFCAFADRSLCSISDVEAL